MSGPIEIDSERGKQLGFTSDKFTAGSYLWEDGKRILISFIASRARGNFRALVAAIHAEGKAVAVEQTENGPCDVWTLEPPEMEVA